VDFYLDQARSLGAKPVSRYPVIPCLDVPRTFAAIHPFASSANKRIPIDTFKRIAAELDMPVHWICGPEEELDGATRINDLYELACWMRGARIFIGNDSGIGHLAAAVGTPTLTLFRSSDPKIWSPRGSACNYIAETPVLTSSSQTL
jgi:ADP-heptose:LPS heptosyltransferase